jgi:hypothetical protein
MKLARTSLWLLVAGVCLCAPAIDAKEALAGERYVDSDEARDETSNRTCALKDLSGLEADEDLNWVWVAEGAKLGGPGKIQIDDVPNKSDVTDPEIGAATKKALEQAFERVGKTSGKGGMRLVSCIYWLERASGERGFVPYAGFYTAQAGVGIEAELLDASGKPVARFRVWGREAADPKQAAYEIADSLANYVRDH